MLQFPKIIYCFLWFERIQKRRNVFPQLLFHQNKTWNMHKNKSECGKVDIVSVCAKIQWLALLSCHGRNHTAHAVAFDWRKKINANETFSCFNKYSNIAVVQEKWKSRYCKFKQKLVLEKWKSAKWSNLDYFFRGINAILEEI